MLTHVVLKATHGELKGQEFALPDGTHWVIGRAPECSIRLHDPSLTTSRYHCAVEVEGPDVSLWDLESRNGTFVNGKNIGQRDWWQIVEEVPLEQGSAYHLCDGDELQVGDNTFEVEFSPCVPCAEGEARDQEQLWSAECLAGV
jgi:pSer/pThr/pTyr-binding forkhead associated (FHA) protein